MSSRILFVQGGGAGTHEEWELYARALPQATVYVLPGRDHQLNNDLSEVARDIRSFER